MTDARVPIRERGRRVLVRWAGAWLLAALHVQAGTSLAQETLTLADAVRQALERNERAIASRERATQAALAEQVARSELSPKLTPNLTGSFGQAAAANQTYGLSFSQLFSTGTELRANLGVAALQNQIGDYFSSDVTFTLSQSFLRGFGASAVRSQIEAAASRVAGEQRRHRLTEQLLAVEVAAAYYRVVTQTEMLAIAQGALARAEELLAASKAKLAVGRVSRLDVVRAEQLAAEADLHVLDARTGIEDAKDQVRRLLNREWNYEFGLEREIAFRPEEVDLDAATRQALEQRPELAMAAEAVVQARRAVELARNQLLPQLDLGVALTRREAADTLKTAFGLGRLQPAAFAAVSMPFDRTRQTVTYQSALLDLAQQERAREALQASVRQEVRQAARQHERLVRSLRLADSAQRLAEEQVELAALRYQRGLSNNLDVVSAESGLLAARGRRVGLLADIALARLRLHVATGTLDPYADVR
jgi:outer membrane protein TolC